MTSANTMVDFPDVLVIFVASRPHTTLKLRPSNVLWLQSVLTGGQPKLLVCLIWLHINFIKVKILGVEPKLIVPTNINPKFAGAEYCRLDFPECYF
ncbi:unnamed protein product [Brassica oleracea var. botrytis]